VAFRDHSPLLYLVLRETEHSYCRPEQDPLDSLLARAPVEVFDEQDVPATQDLDHPRVWLLDSAQSRQLHAAVSESCLPGSHTALPLQKSRPRRGGLRLSATLARCADALTRFPQSFQFLLLQRDLSLAVSC